MPYTLLKVTERGVVLRALHQRRLRAEDGPAAQAFSRFAAEARPGVYAVRLEGDLRAEARPGSRLVDGMPVRLLPSPLAGETGRCPKPAPPCAYDAVRAPGVATLLTSADGGELLEGCSAALLGWDGHSLVCPPDDRPRVWSTAETAVREHLPVRLAPLAVDSAQPLLLVNAVKGPCTVALPGRAPFPEDAIARIAQLFADLTG